MNYKTNYVWFELKKFIKNNFKKMIVSIFLLGTLFMAVVLFLDSKYPDKIEVTPQIDNIDDLETKVVFDFYVERKDGTPASNEVILRRYIESSEVLNSLSEATLIPKENISINTNPKDIPEGNYQVDIEKEDGSGLMTVSVDSKDKKINKQISNFYYNLIHNEEIPFYEDKNLFVFSEPHLESVQDNSNKTNRTDSQKNRSTLSYLLVSYTAAIVLVLTLFILKEWYSEELRYSFTYYRESGQKFLVYDPKINNMSELEQFLRYPLKKESIVLSMPQTNNYLRENQPLNILNNSDRKKISSLTDVHLNDDESEVIIIVVEGITSRDWYKEQQNLLGIYNKSLVKVIQLNQKLD